MAEETPFTGSNEEGLRRFAEFYSALSSDPNYKRLREFYMSGYMAGFDGGLDEGIRRMKEAEADADY